MPKYENAIVYKLCCDDPEITDIYVGSTCNFKVRKNQHKSHCNNENGEKYDRYVYRFIREHGGWGAWSMILVKKYPHVVDNYELKQKECKWIKKLKATLNKSMPLRTKQEWTNDNKEKLIAQKKLFYINNKEKITDMKKTYYDNNKYQIKEQSKAYYHNNKEIISEKNKLTIECECGCIVTRCNIAHHRKSKKHLKLMNNE